MLPGVKSCVHCFLFFWVVLWCGRVLSGLGHENSLACGERNVCVSRWIFSSVFCFGRFLCNGVCIVWNSISGSWCVPPCFCYSPWRVWDLGGGLAFCRAAYLRVFLLVLLCCCLFVCVKPALSLSCGCSLCCIYVAATHCHICAVIYPGVRSA
jgi:hypothetical protein